MRTVIILFVVLITIHQSIRAEEEFDGFKFETDFVEDTIDDALRSSVSSKHPFPKACPWGYFACDNGECVAPNWRCDGHPDCDDFSDELNCTSIDMPPSINSSLIYPSNTSTHIPKTPVQIYKIDFASMVEPLMILSTGQSIRGYWMRSRIYFDIITRARTRPSKDEDSPPSITEAFSVFFGMLGVDQSARTSKSEDTYVKPDNTIVGLDMDPVSREVFWVELGKDPGVFSAVIEEEQFNARQRRGAHVQKKIVEHGLLSPEDIALDTVGRNLYITDAGLPAVVVCSYKHVHCKILVRKKIHKPRAIIADSSNGYIIYTDWGDSPGIFLVSMDGKRRETLIETDVVWPNGLAQDFASNYLYWADSRLNKIERVDLKTRKRYELVKEVGINPFSVSIFENRVYWSDWSGNRIKTCDKMAGNETSVILQAEDIYGIHIYHPDNHKNNDSVNPCWSKHCSHLCLLSPSESYKYGGRQSGPLGATCACPDSMALSVLDKATCYEVHFSFLLVNVKNYIAQVFPERIGLHVLEEIVYSKDHAIQDVATDWSRYKLYFFDATKKQILTADFSGVQTSYQKFDTIGVNSVRGLVYDIPSENLFWLDPDAGTLTLCSVRSKYQRILRDKLYDASSMVLDSRNRVFYISVTGSKRRIFRTDMMGRESSDVVLFEKPDVTQPVALFLDEQQQILYWADTSIGSIDSVSLDVKSRANGCKPFTRTRLRKNLGEILSFVVYYDYLIWASRDSDYLFKARKDDHHSKPIPYKLPPTINRRNYSSEYKRIVTINPMAESLSSPCAKRTCSHACVLMDRQATCLCPDGLKHNGTQCISETVTEPPPIVKELAEISREKPAAPKYDSHTAPIILGIFGLALAIGVLLFLKRQRTAPAQDNVMLLFDNDN